MTFVRKLASNISKICNVDLKHIDIMIDRIFIPYSIENLNNLNYVFGISSYSPVFQLNFIYFKAPSPDISYFLMQFSQKF